jgi:hypothetical protein
MLAHVRSRTSGMGLTLRHSCPWLLHRNHEREGHCAHKCGFSLLRKVRKIRQCDKRGRLAGRQMLDARIPNVQAPAPHDARREPVQLRVCGHFELGCTPNDPVTARLGASTSGPIVKCDETFSPLAAKRFHRVGPEVDPSNFAFTGALWVNLSSK